MKGAVLGFVSGVLMNINLTDTITTFIMGGVGALGGYVAIQGLKILANKFKPKNKDENNNPR